MADQLGAGSGCLLASCSQDCYIRLWRLRREDSDTVHTDSDDDLKLTENSFSLLEGDGVERKYTVMLESVLIGTLIPRSCDGHVIYLFVPP